MALLANVVVEKTTYAFDSPFSYYVPSALEESLKAGCRVMVPFGAANRKRQGLVLSVEEETVIPEKPLKEVAAQVDAEPILNEEQLWLMKLLHERVFCTWYDAMKVLIPSGLGVKINVLCSLNPRWEDPMQEGRPEDIDRILTYLRSKKKPVALALLQEELEINQNNRAMAWLINEQAVLLTEDVRQKTKDVTVQMIRLAEQYESGEEEPQGMTAKQKSVYRLLLDCGCASVKEAAYFCGVTTAVIKNMVKHGIVEEFGKPVLRNPYEEADFAPEKQKITLTADQQKACDELKRVMAETPGATALLHGVTGSGKTQVFLQLIQHVLDQGRQVIVMVPEISLTPQTVEVFQRRFGRRVAVMHSGLTMGERVDEYKRIRQGAADVVIGTRSSVFAPLDNIGLIVMDEDTCMVDIAKFFLEFTVDESCGKCVPCRVGTMRLLEILEKITSGNGTLADIDKLEELSKYISSASLCALGQTAPNPVLSTLRYFRDEYIAHVTDKTCPAHVCKELMRYQIDATKCKGCTACARKCPVGAITGGIRQPHTIDAEKCIKCGVCISTCKFDAIVKA